MPGVSLQARAPRLRVIDKEKVERVADEGDPISAINKLESKKLPLQKGAIEMLIRFGDESVVPVLCHLITRRHRDQDVRQRAIRAVEQLTGLSIEQIPSAKCKFVDRFVQRRVTAETQTA